MKKVFLSHSSFDKTAVLSLAQDLRSRNISVWLDEWEIEAGDNSIPEKIQEGLQDASFVPVWRYLFLYRSNLEFNVGEFF